MRRAPSRPVVVAAVAVVAGGLLGAHVVTRPWGALAIAVAVLGATFCVGLAVRGVRWAAPLVAALAALLAAPSAPELPASLDSRARPESQAGWAPGPEEFAGVLEHVGRRARLDSAPGLTFELPAGAAERGEFVRLAPSRPSRVEARGPNSAPDWPPGSSGSGPLPVRLDELRRVGPDSAWRPPVAALRRRVLARARSGAGPDEHSNVSREPSGEGARADGLAACVLFGARDAVAYEDRARFARTGLGHLLAVSGWHTAMLAALAFGPLGRLVEIVARRAGIAPSRAALCATAARVAGLALFAPLAGGAPPVRRAALALALATVAPHLPAPRLGTTRAPAGRSGSRAARDAPRQAPGHAPGRAADGASLWGLALFLEWAADPAAPTRLDVQLSYAAAFGLALAARPLARWARRTDEAWLDTGGNARRVLHAIGTRMRRAGALGLGASAAAVVATAPIVWSAFGELAPVGMLATPLLAPLLAALLCGALLTALVPCCAPDLCVDAPAAALFAAVTWLDRLPGTPWLLPARPWWWVAGASAATLAWSASLAWNATRGGKRSRLLGRAAALAWGALLLPWEPAPRDLELVALDVGHGTAVAWRAPGWGVWIFDAGSRDRGRVGSAALAPLLSHWEASAPTVVLSHGDRDHAGGLLWLVERLPPRAWAGALPALLSERLPHTCPVQDVDPGSVILPGGPARDRVRLVRGAPGDDNHGSRSLALEVAGKRVLLCGDAEGAGLGRMIQEGALEGPWDVLLWPHHGSDTPLLDELLEVAAPRQVWVSGSGRPAIGDELDRRGVPWHSTADAGALRLDASRTPDSTRVAR